jgi:hypothetical protein
MALAISNVQAAIGDSARNYLYKMVIETVPLALSTLFTNAKEIAENIDIYSTKGIFPTTKVDTIKLEWGGEFIWFTGVESSKKEGEIEFICDQDCKAIDFFEACSALTNIPKSARLLNIGVYLLHVDKETVIDYRRAVDSQILGIEPLGSLDKAGKELFKFKANIVWDKVQKDSSRRGKTV